MEPQNIVILVTGSYDHTLKLWDPIRGNALDTIEFGEDQLVNRIEVSKDKQFIVGAFSSSIKIFDINKKTTKPVHFIYILLLY